KLLTKHETTFSESDADLGRTGIIKHRIPTGNAHPIKQPVRRLPIQMNVEINQQIDDMLEKDVIQPSSSPWASGIVMVQKKDGTKRFCVDHRRLNDVTTKDAYPLPRIDDSLDQLSGAKWFSCLDLNSGYWQVEVDDDDREKTAFASRKGLFEFKVMPFGLCNAPASFERLMETVLAGLNWQICLIYLDDIIVTGKTFEDMVNNLDQVFNRLSDANLKLKPRKCRLFAREVEFLGHIISEQGIKTDPKKTEIVTTWPRPKNVHQ
ncbi:MAG: reverse transcriptase family protein, partial [Candidatus Thiodiazotropha endolucinida]|nr:reverse transcriptase family protein [Candidatus Thiodiazotropha endolucinida]